MSESKITIFTDGSSRGNPGRGGWGAITLYPNSKGEMKVDELGGREDATTNNRMELTAALMALAHFDGYYESFESYRFIIHTDSSYLINGITKWVKGWQKNNWMTATKQQVVNQDLWEKLVDVSIDKKVTWMYVAGHAGIPANERCDVVATSYADKLPVDLYKGTLANYSVDLKNLTGHLIGAKKESKESKARSKAKAFSYVSVIDGKVLVHKTWAECEKRVKGKKARFKKALSPSEEKNLIAEYSK